MKTEIAPFTVDMVAAAAVLLAQPHRRQHQRLSLLPERFVETAVAEQALISLLQKPTTSDYAALRGGQIWFSRNGLPPDTQH